MSRRRVVLVVAVGVLMAGTVVYGCASHTSIRMDLAADPTMELVWPSPPDAARIRYLRSVSSPRDLGVSRSLFGRMSDFVIGGDDDLRVHQPYGIAVDSAQRIYVADQAAPGVHVFDPVQGRHRLFRGSDRRQFELPIGVAVDDEGNIFVSDAEAGTVIGMNGDGKEFLAITDGLERPAGLALDNSRDLLYVVDVQRHEIPVFDRKGNLIRTLGGRGTDPGRMNFPTNVAVGRDGTVYVTDTMNFRVQIFSPEGELISTFGEVGRRPGEFARPKGIGVDSDGHIYVVEGLFDAVNVFDRDGRLLLTFGQEGRSAGEFWLATGLFVDAQDRIYVADSFNGRFQVFQYLTGGER